MNTVIYLANKQIQIVEGTASKGALSVKRYYSVEAPEGSIINGIVMDTDSFITSHNIPHKSAITQLQ